MGYLSHRREEKALLTTTRNAFFSSCSLAWIAGRYVEQVSLEVIVISSIEENRLFLTNPLKPVKF